MKNKKRSKLLFLLAAIGVVSAAGYTLFISPRMDVVEYEYQETTVLCGDLEQGITESGSVDFVTESMEYELDFSFSEEDEDEEDEEEENSGFLQIEEIYIANGQRVTLGEPVLKFTEKSIRSLRQKLKSAQTEAEIVLAESETDYELEALTARQTYDSSVLSGSNAENLYQLESGTLQKEIEQTQAQIAVWELQIEQLEEELEESWEDFNDLEEAYEEAFYDFEHTQEKASVTNYITVREEYLNLKEQYETEQEDRLEKREEMVRLQEDIDNQSLIIDAMLKKLERRNLNARQSLEESSLTGEMAESVYSYTLENLSESLASSEEEVEEARKDLEEFEAFVMDGTLCAAEDGLITSINHEAGDYLTATGPLYQYVEEGNHVISIDIAEEDVPYIYVGEEVNIEFSAYPEEYYQGIVTEITTSASQEHSTTISYPVTIEIAGDTSKLYGGMTGDITFVTQEAEEVLYIPKKSIIRQDDKTFVYKQNGTDKYALSEIQIGFSDGIHVQVTDGLEEGEKIYIASVVTNEQDDTITEKEGTEESTAPGAMMMPENAGDREDAK